MTIFYAINVELNWIELNYVYNDQAVKVKVMSQFNDIIWTLFLFISLTISNRLNIETNTLKNIFIYPENKLGI